MPSKRLEIFCQMSSLATWMIDHRDHESAEYIEAFNEMNRLRGELCRAQGVAEQDISSDGYDISQRAYEHVKASWIYNLTQVDGHKYVEGARKAHAQWIERRPDLAEGDDWLAGLTVPASQGRSPAWRDGYEYAQRMHTEHGHGPATIANSAAVYVRETYESPAERAEYDDGISAYLYLTFAKGAES